jgi:hypothetical protein
MIRHIAQHDTLLADLLHDSTALQTVDHTAWCACIRGRVTAHCG